jgi:hypothetical protein
LTNAEDDDDEGDSVEAGLGRATMPSLKAGGEVALKIQKHRTEESKSEDEEEKVITSRPLAKKAP